MLASYGGTCRGYKNENYDIALAGVRHPLRSGARLWRIRGRCMAYPVPKKTKCARMNKCTLSRNRVSIMRIPRVFCINRDVKCCVNYTSVARLQIAQEEAGLGINLFLRYFPYSTCARGRNDEITSTSAMLRSEEYRG